MNRAKKLLHISLGLFLVLVGIAGLILPILNGLVPLLLGFILLSFESPYIEAKLAKAARKTKLTGEWYEKLDRWMRKIFRR